MQISRKAEYAMHALIYVAAVNGQRTCSINEIAANTSIPREYLAKVLKHLTNKRFLVSSRGVNGGYRLAKAPVKISFLDVLEATQGPFNNLLCESKDCCPAFNFWDDLHKQLKRTLSDMNLGKLDYEKYRAKIKK
jgi:Rrf2 family protein